MPVPFVAVALFKIAAAAITTYEAYQALDDVFDSVDGYKDDLDKAKKQLEKYFKQIKEEIDNNIDAREEVFVLEALAAADPVNKGCLLYTSPSPRDA